jgi:hypothetical protein
MGHSSVAVRHRAGNCCSLGWRWGSVIDDGGKKDLRSAGNYYYYYVSDFSIYCYLGYMT